MTGHMHRPRPRKKMPTGAVHHLAEGYKSGGRSPAGTKLHAGMAAHTTSGGGSGMSTGMVKQGPLKHRPSRKKGFHLERPDQHGYYRA